MVQDYSRDDRSKLGIHTKAESANAPLRGGETRYRSFIDSIEEGVAFCEVVRNSAGLAVDLIYVDLNAGVERQTGMSRNAFIGRMLSAVSTRKDFEQWMPIHARVADTGEAITVESFAESTQRWYQFSVYPGAKDEIAIFVRDIDERKRAEKVLRENEERQAFLLKLSDSLRPLTDPLAARTQAMRQLVEHLGLVRAALYEIDDDQNSMTLMASVETDAIAWPQKMFMSDYASDILSTYRAGNAYVVNDSETDTRLSDKGRSAIRALGIRSLVGIPLVENGQLRTVLGAQARDPREWAVHDLQLLQDVAERVWSSLGEARVETALRESEALLRQFGEASQDVLWIREAQSLQWQYLTPAFETIYGLSRGEALSGNNYRSWMDLIVPEDRQYVEKQIQRVRDGEHVTFDYRVRRPLDGMVRWLRNTDFPISDKVGKVALIGGIGHDMTELREAERRMEILIQGIPQLVWRAVDNGHWTWASSQWMEFTGQSAAESTGWGWLDALHPDDRQSAREEWALAADRSDFEMEYRVCRSGRREYRWFKTRATAVRDEAGAATEWLGTSTDIHELRELQERQRVLVAELQHRTRNLMGVVRAMAEATGKATSSFADFEDRFNDRLKALARVQGLLSRLEDNDRVAFDELIGTELAAMDGAADQVSLKGPSGVRLRSSTVQTLAMALHELATNAMKYGALKQPGGRLSVTWHMAAPDRHGRPALHIEWTESGVRMPKPGAAAQGSGQGRELIEKALPYQLKAKTSFEMTPDGVHCTILVPVSSSN